MRVLLAVIPLLLAATPLYAASETKDPGAVPAGTYAVDPTHATVVARIGHLGFSTTTVRFDTVSGALTYDPAHPETSSANVTVQADGLYSGFAARDKELEGPAWFNASAHPVATFKATRLERTGPNTARLPGELTLLGVTRPLTLDLTFNGYGKGLDGAPRVGFSAKGAMKRSDFGMKTFLGPVADEVDLEIEAEFARK